MYVKHYGKVVFGAIFVILTLIGTIIQVLVEGRILWTAVQFIWLIPIIVYLVANMDRDIEEWEDEQ